MRPFFYLFPPRTNERIIVAKKEIKFTIIKLTDVILLHIMKTETQ